MLMALAATHVTSPALAAESTIDRINRFILDLAPPASERYNDPEYRKGVRRVVLPDGRVIHIDTNAEVQLSVNFAFNSFQLTEESRSMLSDLGAALNSSTLIANDYFIGGHTDAKGSNAYNLGLSRQRAAGVQSYLVGPASVSQQRLVAVGFGEEYLAQPSLPNAAVNRRVNVSLIVANFTYEAPTMVVPDGGLVAPVAGGYSQGSTSEEALPGSNAASTPSAPPPASGGNAEETGVSVPSTAANEGSAGTTAPQQSETVTAPPAASQPQQQPQQSETVATPPASSQPQQPQQTETVAAPPATTQQPQPQQSETAATPPASSTPQQPAASAPAVGSPTGNADNTTNSLINN